MAGKSTFGFGAENYVSDADISTPRPLSSPPKNSNPDASEDVKGRGDLASLNRGSVVTAGLEGDLAHMGTDFIGAAQDADMLNAAHAAGRSTVSSSDLAQYDGVIKNAVTGPSQAVSDEIQAMIPAELRPLAEARIDAEMRRSGRNPDETAQQRDQRVQEEQSQIQDAVLGGTGLLGALDSMSGQAKPVVPDKQASESKENSPFEGLLAGFGPLNLGSSAKDMGATGAVLADHANLQHGLATDQERQRDSRGIA